MKNWHSGTEYFTPPSEWDQKLDVYVQKKQNFIDHFSQIVKVLTEDDMGHPDSADAIALLKEVLEYNVIGGKY